MARSIATIQATMDAEQALQTDLTTLNSPSQTAIYRLWKFITSTIINYLEQLWDIYKAELETQISAAAVGSNAWLQSKVMKFQYSASTPQVLAVDSNFAINYPTIDTTLQIITRCSVTTTSQRVCLVKVAKSDPPVALSAPELSSLSGFLSDLNFAGVNYVAQSLTSDKIYIDADIYYNGQYASTISANVITAINAYLASIPFDGKIKLMSLIDAIQAVTGVTDVVLKNVAIRADATAFANKTYLVQNKTSIIPLYQMYAGYATEETTSGYTFTDTLVFIAQ